ncbi:uncharacterized protein [Aristolochia californica]|uniref:uncharacterized protein n=1 Tax=Aristolochia californica TaxID=171875 RepID=UPI0035DD0ABE
MESQSLLKHFWHGGNALKQNWLLSEKLMPGSALTTTKEKKLTGRQWFERGRAAVKGVVSVNEESEGEDEEDIDFDDDFEDDEEDMLEHYLAERFEGHPIFCCDLLPTEP